MSVSRLKSKVVYFYFHDVLGLRGPAEQPILYFGVENAELYVNVEIKKITNNTKTRKTKENIKLMLVSRLKYKVAYFHDMLGLREPAEPSMFTSASKKKYGAVFQHLMWCCVCSNNKQEMEERNLNTRQQQTKRKRQ